MAAEDKVVITASSAAVRLADPAPLSDPTVTVEVQVQFPGRIDDQIATGRNGERAGRLEGPNVDLGLACLSPVTVLRVTPRALLSRLMEPSRAPPK